MKQASTYHLIGDELLIAVFNEFPIQKQLNFKDESYIMRAFYQASKKSTYSSLFRNYHFDEDGVMPYSREIAEGINILHQSSLLGKMNPSFSYYQLTKGINIRYDNFISPKLNSKQKALIHKLSLEMKKKLGVVH